MNPIDPVQVWENHAGPVPSLRSGPSISYKYNFVAYRDPESDSSRYGYGNTEADAILDFLEQEVEHLCSHCNAPCSTASFTDDPRFSDCIMMDHNRDAWLRRWMPEDDASHREWREINGPISR